MPGQIELYDVRDLQLDPLNPRLPESLRGASQSEILAYLRDYGVLEELAQSFLDNGFFNHEPVIVLRAIDGERHTVLEGNRRLAALMILHEVPEADGLELAGIRATREQLQELEQIPCYPIEHRDEVHRFLGFRHIGGIKTWSAEAKARYLLAEVDRAVKDGSQNPFRDVGRQVGSNALGVRGPYTAIRILTFARDELGLDTRYVQHERFGVWLRCMSSAEILSHIGFGRATTYIELQDALAQISADRLREVLADLTPQGGRARALLADSRDVTDYGRVLASSRASAVLRRHEDLSLARQIIDELDLPQRIRRLAESCRLLIDELHTADVTAELDAAAEELAGVARSIRDIVRSRMRDE